MRYFFDTSSLVKIYHKESGSDIVLSIYNSQTIIFISELSRLEFISTINKKYRNKEFDSEALSMLKDRFFFDTYNRFRLIPLTSILIDTAIDLITEYGKSKHLIILDAIQLSAFSSIENAIFVSGDKRFNSIIKNIGYNLIEV